MIISFFEEYPAKENLDKLRLITFPSRLYLASKSLKEFKELKAKIKNKHILDIIYWPTLERKEGYWYSPFSNHKALKRTLNEIPLNQEVMIDLELPTTQNPKLYFKEFHNFFRNRNLISKFIKSHKKIYTAEYFPDKFALRFLGLNYNPQKYNSKVIKMFYTSMWKFSRSYLEKRFKEGKTKFDSNFVPGFGTIARGEGGNEPILSTNKLEKDLALAQKNNIEEVIIFRLGGLNKNYLKVISKFI